MNQFFAKEATAKAVKKALASYGIMPGDAKLVTDETPTPCEILTYESATLATIAGANDPAGTFIVELTVAVTAPPSDLNHIDMLIYDTDTTGGC